MSLQLLLHTFIFFTAHSFFPHEIQQLKESAQNALHINPKRFLLTKINHTTTTFKGSDTGSLTLSPSIITSDTEWITVSWNNISYTGKYDWIGLFNASAADTSYAAPPLKYQYICPAYKGCSYAPASGSLKFKILNRRTAYIFAYVTESNPYREIKGVSAPISYHDNDLYAPMHVHIAAPSSPVNVKCGITNSCMQLMWIQKQVNTPLIKYGVSPSNFQFSIPAADKCKLSANNFCGQQYGLPAGTSGYFDTGYMITAYLLTLQPDTVYFYQVGDEMYGWTETYNFTSNPLYGALTQRGDIRMIIFGDLGNVAIDYSMHHSWDFGNRGEIYSINTTKTMDLFTNGYKEFADVVVHIGDISYAVGFLSEWDDFLHQIEPIAAHIPWMTGIGNHEYSWTGEWKPPIEAVTADAFGNADGGGECGVPYNFYFPFANWNQAESRKAMYDPNIVQPWYVFDYGMVRTIMVSTEHDFSRDSVQYAWIKNTLHATDRALFPWVFVTGHRPMYTNDDWDGDVSTARYIRECLEELMDDFGVALGFWGHQHSYGRTCPVYNGECKEDGAAAVHLVVGMAGYELSRTIQPAEFMVFQNNTVYGFVHLTVYNEMVLNGKFVNANTTEIVDEFFITNPYNNNISN